MELVNTGDKSQKPPIYMVVYGEGGVGKTTFAANAPNPIIADCERGTKYLGSRGIDVDVAHIETWSDMGEFQKYALQSDHETIVIDPIGELMEKLQSFMRGRDNSKLTQSDGQPTMAGWGWLKRNMRRLLKSFRDSGKNLVIVAHVDEDKDEQNRIIKRPMLQTKLSEEMRNMVDIVAYMTVAKSKENPNEHERTLICTQKSDRYYAKDRTGKLDFREKPDWDSLLEKIYSPGEWDEMPRDDNEGDNDTEDEQASDDTDEDDDIPDDVITLDEVGLTTQAVESLGKVGIKTVSELDEATNRIDDFESIDGVGPKSAETMRDIVNDESVSDEKEEAASKLNKHN